jgi:hypothetical protein
MRVLPMLGNNEIIIETKVVDIFCEGWLDNRNNGQTPKFFIE